MKFTAEQITRDWGAKCNECDPECYTCQVWSMFEEIEQLSDKVDGLSADLDSAVEVAFKRGAYEWVRLNYPADYERLKSSEAQN